MAAQKVTFMDIYSLYFLNRSDSGRKITEGNWEHWGIAFLVMGWCPPRAAGQAS